MSVRITALTDPQPSASGYRLVWLAVAEEGHPVGSAALRMFTGPGQDHAAELDVQVHPGERRRGVGSLLLEAAVAAAREDGRRSLATWAGADSPAALFLPARGFEVVQTYVHTRLPLGEVDLGEVVAGIEQPHPGYRLTSWEGLVPDSLAATFVASRRAMDDTPTGGADSGTMVWDLDRVRTAVTAVERRGDRLHTVVAVDASDGSIAGFTELVVPGDGTGDGQHYGTGVLPGHRGHGLARWMKLASIHHARRQYPDLAGLLTDTADDNPFMRRINDSLGYLPTHTAHEYRLAL
ncbi:GNAT family N-acetyltransferase [Kitasatospora sp. NPDC051853]|uniref:GNAT family N-acetyltransferase n=1 Tax=Kitasatospora sp. NPDC051853 TaxID=3364058 RepID=UPI00379B6B74